MEKTAFTQEERDTLNILEEAHALYDDYIRISKINEINNFNSEENNQPQEAAHYPVHINFL